MCMWGRRNDWDKVCAPEAAGPSFGHIDRNTFARMRMEKSLDDNSRVRVGKYLGRLRNIKEPINVGRTTESSFMNPRTSSAILERKLTA